MLGDTGLQLPGQSVLNLFLPSDRSRLTSALANISTHPHQTLNALMHLPHQLGKFQLVRLTLEMLQSPQEPFVLLKCQVIDPQLKRLTPPSRSLLSNPRSIQFSGPIRLTRRSLPLLKPSLIRKLEVQQRVERERLIRVVIQAIRNSLDLTAIFSTTAQEIARLLQVDRVEIFQYIPLRKHWLNVADYRQDTNLPSILGVEISDAGVTATPKFRKLEVIRREHNSLPSEGVPYQFTTLFPGSWLIIPLYISSSLWGCLSLVRTKSDFSWQVSEAEISYIVADQLAIAIQQSQLYRQIQRMNSNLNRQTQAQIAQLKLAYEFEATLIRITEKIRNSLDEDQIMQTVVQELAQAIGADYCNAALYNLEQRVAAICYENTVSSTSLFQNKTVFMDDFPEQYQQLLQRQSFQFCPLYPFMQEERVAILACPIADDQEVLGDLWIVHQNYRCFGEQDLRLAQHVADHCAIALRQSRLYQTAQAQVSELEKLHHLKDDFLSTVSHELRTPMANIRMATQMLEVLVGQIEQSAADHYSLAGSSARINTTAPSSTISDLVAKITRYIHILQQECQRETQLINDLLDLSRIDSCNEPLPMSAIDVSEFIATITAPFAERASSQQQDLCLEIADDLPPLMTHPQSLERILTELLNNACKYTPIGRAIVVSATMREIEPCSGFLSLCVTNSGVVIPPESLTCIFERFYRVPNNDPWRHGGTGLGLALAKKLTEQLGGKIHVTSGADKTSFTVELPYNCCLDAHCVK